jgi:hypothetical protein
MAEGIKELQLKVSEFYKLLETIPDKPSSSSVFISFLRAFLRVRSEISLPTIEVMTVLKKSKPIVFMTMRKAAAKYDMLQFLIELSTEDQEADHKLKTIIKMESS